MLELLALGAAQSVNAIQSKGDQPDCDRLRHADETAEALDLDMVNWFTPTAENYFGRVTKAQFVSALAEIGKGGLSDPAKASKRQAAEARRKQSRRCRLAARASSQGEITCARVAGHPKGCPVFASVTQEFAWSLRVCRIPPLHQIRS